MLIVTSSVHGSLHWVHGCVGLLGKLLSDHHLLVVAVLHWLLDLHRWGRLDHLRVPNLLLILGIVRRCVHHLRSGSSLCLRLLLLLLLPYSHALNIYLSLLRCHLHVHWHSLTSLHLVHARVVRSNLARAMHVHL